VAAGKKVFYGQVDQGLDEAYRLATAAMIDCVGSADGQEGIAAFVEKREPRWKDQ
jgi:enoyl-CoA hydratase/carnithine racemase